MFKTHFFHTFFIFFTKHVEHVKKCEKYVKKYLLKMHLEKCEICVLKMHLEKNPRDKKTFQNCKKCENVNKRQFLFLSSIFHVFSQI
jgi:hypothetical protein